MYPMVYLVRFLQIVMVGAISHAISFWSEYWGWVTLMSLSLLFGVCLVHRFFTDWETDEQVLFGGLFRRGIAGGTLAVLLAFFPVSLRAWPLVGLAAGLIGLVQ